MTKVTVIDTIMGAGKTSYMIEVMNRSYPERLFGGHDRRFIFVTLLLDEVERIKDQCPDLKFKDPKPINGHKLKGLLHLINNQENIATTHALFKEITQETKEALNAANYTLVIDEALTCCEVLKDLTKHDQDDLFEAGKIYREEGTHNLRWDNNKHNAYQGKFSKIKDQCNNGNLAVYTKEKTARKILIWQFPTAFLKCFEEVYILTYLFQGSAMCSYLEAEGVPFELKAVLGNRKDGYELISWDDHDEREAKTKIRNLVTIHEGKGNDIGIPINRKNPLSSSWFKKASPATLKVLHGNTVTFFKNHAKTPSRENAWTTFKTCQPKLKGPAYSGKGCWIPLNTKATNDFKHKRSMAYLSNRFLPPVLSNFFVHRGVEINDDIFAISEMVQVIWRTAIREDEPIHLYIPSERMRNLLKLWLKCDSTSELMQKLDKKTPFKIAA